MDLCVRTDWTIKICYYFRGVSGRRRRRRSHVGTVYIHDQLRLKNVCNNFIDCYKRFSLRCKKY